MKASLLIDGTYDINLVLPIQQLGKITLFIILIFLINDLPFSLSPSLLSLIKSTNFFIALMKASKSMKNPTMVTQNKSTYQIFIMQTRLSN
ncbi:hypothetical protein lpp2366 [Legionella pneumophila str. Paris]|nr:hypothetical protein lpp2366 [Legionella pneumophila str. Paris]